MRGISMQCMICKSEVNNESRSCPLCGANPWRMPESFLNSDQHQTWLNEIYMPQYEKWIERQKQESIADPVMEIIDSNNKSQDTHQTDDIKSLNMRWLKDRARLGHIEAQFELAIRYYFGKRGAKIDKSKAYELFLQVSKNEGSIYYESACYIIADCLFYGIGIERNEGQAALYYQQIWERRYYNYLYNIPDDLGSYEALFDDYADDFGVYLYIPDELGSNLGGDALYMYAYCLYHSIGVDQNYSLAFRIINYIAHSKFLQIDPSGMRYIYENLFLLAECYYYGRGVETNYELAFQLYTRYIDLGHGVVDWKTGEIDWSGISSIEQRIKQNKPNLATQYYPIYYDLKDFNYEEHPIKMLGNCYYQIAECYFLGHGTNINYRIAHRLYQEAQRLGYPVEKAKMRHSTIKAIFNR